MPTQISGIQITDNQDGTCDVQIGPEGVGGLAVSGLFDFSSFRDGQLTGNVRLTRAIGNYGALGSQELAARLNASGLHLSDGDYSGFAITDNGDGSATVAFNNQTLTVGVQALGGDRPDQQLLLWNLTSFLRLAGFTDLTTPSQSFTYRGMTAIQAVASHVFWF